MGFRGLGFRDLGILCLGFRGLGIRVSHRARKHMLHKRNFRHVHGQSGIRMYRVLGLGLGFSGIRFAATCSSQSPRAMLRPARLLRRTLGSLMPVLGMVFKAASKKYFRKLCECLSLQKPNLSLCYQHRCEHLLRSGLGV